jgi:hypothetical protein
VIFCVDIISSWTSRQRKRWHSQRGPLVQGAGSGELIDGRATLKPRIDTYERFGPKPIAGIYFLDLSTDVRRTNLRK